MNNLQSAIGSLQAMKLSMDEHSAKLNEILSKLGLHKIDIESSLKNIDKQIKSADNSFTISIVGTFKAGKSTIINSLLELQDEARLSSEFDPDTAKAIRLIYREEGHCEAEVDFGGVYPIEQATWAQAKKYTSHIALERESESFRKKAEAVEEVRYYIASPFLKTCNIFDLPGTGVGTYEKDIEVADTKILESDCYLWVVSTDTAPDMQTIANLEKLRHKVVPIINVWQKKFQGIEGQFKPEEIQNILENDFSAYISSADSFITYYAGEVDEAQNEGRELDPAWGKESLVSKLIEIISEATSTDRAKRIETNLLKAISDCERAVMDVKDSSELQKLKAATKRDSTDAKRLSERLTQCKKTVNGAINLEAKKTANELIDIITRSTSSFIEMKMYSLDFSALAKKRYAEKLEREFKASLDLDGDWVKSLSHEYSDDLKALLDGKYSEFAMELDDINVASNGPSFDTSPFNTFVNDISNVMLNQLIEKIVPIVIKIVGQVVLALIPVLNFADVFLAVFSTLSSASSISKNDKIQSQCQMVIRSSRVKISQQGYTIMEDFKKIGVSLGNDYYEIIRSEVEKRGMLVADQVELLHSLDSSITSFGDTLKSQRDAASKLFTE